jgi:membrane-bound transcription factor site-1 protease
VINLSVGGPDFADEPFGDKVREIVASGITLVSAMGNDGPAWGTLNAPGDAVEVVGVGASEADSGRVAAISSRGFPLGDRIPRMKPDYLAPGMGVLGAIPGGATCSPNHGTSVASPSIAGVAALVVSAARRAGTSVRNPAMVRQCLNEASSQTKESMWAQGFGRINSLKAVKCAETYVPRVTLVPDSFNLVKDCPYLAPLCDQPLIRGGLPISFNLTVLNGLGVLGSVSDMKWAGSTSVKVEAQYPVALWPFAGAFGVSISAKPDSKIGVHTGKLWVRVESHEKTCSDTTSNERWVPWPVSVEIINKPDKKKRLLWDASHSLTYPPSFSPRDNLNQNADLLDWNGDLPYTNFRGLFRRLRSRGYFVDVWHEDLSCVDLSEYGALLLVDAEDVYSQDEIKAISGTSLLIVADWADAALREQTRFFDDNTQVAWQPVIGGANIVSLNKLLKPYDVALGGGAWEGPLPASFGAGSRFESGSVIARAPIGSYVVKTRLEKRVSLKRGGTVKVEDLQAVLAAVDNEQGRVVVFGDTGCLDDWKRSGRACWELLEASVAFAVSGVRSPAIFPDTALLKKPLVIGEVPRDAPPSSLLKKYSRHYDAKQPYVADPPPLKQTCGNGLRVVETRPEGWSPV